jgi:hypothetical protein
MNADRKKKDFVFIGVHLRPFNSFVFGEVRGCFDDEFKAESVRFFEKVRQGRSAVVISKVTLDELELAPGSRVGWARKMLTWENRRYGGVNSLHSYRSPRIYSPVRL